ncbi:MAG: biotin--[acetyl-CoA-carboxylase] ligase [Akkermansiaceae bacterium]|nr:biotin--[acetyl-CoA-carboxylase] ligase [Akkermansiaceae bacterium]
MSRYFVTRFPELDSTNRHALAHLDELADGQVIQADVQTAGHGRMRRKWVSHVPGNLCLTLVLKPPAAAKAAAMPLANLSQLLALSVCRALEAYGAAATIKWPNDVLVGGRKIAGLLAETVVRGSRLSGIALGVGVNLNLDEAVLAEIDQPATALCQVTGSTVRVEDFRDLVLEDFFDRREALMERGFPLIREEYRARCPFLGSRVEVRRPGGTVLGIARDISPEGALELLADDGGLLEIGIGEIFAAP